MRITVTSSSVAIKLVKALPLFLIVLQLHYQKCNSAVTYNYTRSDFPPDFVFGASTSAFQVEGAASEDGRTPSIFDNFAHTVLPTPPEDIKMYSGDVGCDQYHKYKEDVKLMVDTGIEAYRFSISWSRLIPKGRGPVNTRAVTYYDNLINELISNGIQPHIVLLHWDLPQSLEKEYGGWNNRQIVQDFLAYANVCFKEFGDRVLHWTTINEPNWMVFFCDDSPLGSCMSKRDPYIGAHNLLLAHASIVRLYKTKYQEQQHGYVGLNIMDSWIASLTDTKEDILAAQRARDFVIGWFLNPLVYGDYPNAMKLSVGNRLPSFTDDESKLVKNSFDFIAVNCYTKVNIKNHPNNANVSLKNYVLDMEVETIDASVEEYQEAVQHVLEYLKQEYGNPAVYIHENGYLMERSVLLDDTPRAKFHHASIGGLLNALRTGSNIKGYFIWSFLDVFELSGDYNGTYGLYYVDFSDSNLKRYPKFSAHWYTAFLKGKNFDMSITMQQESDLVSFANFSTSS